MAPCLFPSTNEVGDGVGEQRRQPCSPSVGLAPRALEAWARCWAWEREGQTPERSHQGCLLEAVVFQPGLEEWGDVAQLRLTDGIMDGGAARTKWWRQEKQVVPGVWCGMS